MIRTVGDRPHARRSFLPRKRNGAARWFHGGSWSPRAPSSRSALARSRGAIPSDILDTKYVPPGFPGNLHPAATRVVAEIITLGRGYARSGSFHGGAVPDPRITTCLPRVPTCVPFTFRSYFSWSERFAFGLKLVWTGPIPRAHISRSYRAPPRLSRALMPYVHRAYARERPRPTITFDSYPPTYDYRRFYEGVFPEREKEARKNIDVSRQNESVKRDCT